MGGDRWRDPGEFSPTRYYVAPAASYLRSVATLAPLVASSRTLSLGISAFWGDGFSRRSGLWQIDTQIVSGHLLDNAEGDRTDRVRTGVV